MLNLTYSKIGRKCSLSVFPEAIRGLRSDGQYWRIFVSDPEIMAVSVFRISQTTISEYETETRQYPAPAVKLVQEHGKSFFAWLLTKQSVEVELENSKGVPSMFAPHSPVAGPSPDLDIAPPKVIPPSFPTRS